MPVDTDLVLPVLQCQYTLTYVSSAEVPIATVLVLALLQCQYTPNYVNNAEVPIATVLVLAVQQCQYTLNYVSSAVVPVATNFPTALLPISTFAYQTTQRSTDRPSGRQVAVDSGEPTSPTALTFCVCVQLDLCQPKTTVTNTIFFTVSDLIKHLFNTAADPTNLTQPYWIINHECPGWTEDLLQQSYNSTVVQSSYVCSAVGSLQRFLYPQIYLNVRQINRYGVKQRASDDKRTDTQSDTCRYYKQRL